jgi:undecaprenyl pyrophosphate synthase
MQGRRRLRKEGAKMNLRETARKIPSAQVKSMALLQEEKRYVVCCLCMKYIHKTLTFFTFSGSVRKRQKTMIVMLMKMS